MLSVAACDASSSTHTRPRVVLILLENHEYSGIVGNPCCPYINDLAEHGTLFTDYTAVTHPSLPNYLALTSGETHGRVGTDNTAMLVDSPNLFAQLSSRGISWRAYEQSIPGPCFRGLFAGSKPNLYALKHDPAMMYSDVSGSNLCRFVVPWTGPPNVLPQFSFVTPNECTDMHSCDARLTDDWLRQYVPELLKRLGLDGRILITWDEGDTNLGGGGHVATILIGPGVPHARVSTPLNHYSLLGGLENLFRVPRLGHARTVRPLPLFVP